MAERLTLAQREVRKYGLAGAMRRKQARDRATAVRVKQNLGLSLTDVLRIREAGKKGGVTVARPVRDVPFKDPWPEWAERNKPGLLEKAGSFVGENVARGTNAGLKYSGLTQVPGVKTAARVVTGVQKDLAMLPAGVAHLATQSPFKSINEIANAAAAPFVNPSGTFRDRPQDFLYAALTPVTLGGSSIARGGAAMSAARQASLARIALRTGERGAKYTPTTASASPFVSGAKAFARKPDFGSRTITLRNPKTGEATGATLAMNFDSPLGRPIAKATDRLLGLDGRPLKGPRRGKVISPAVYENVPRQLPNPEHAKALSEYQGARTGFRGAATAMSKSEQLAGRLRGARKVVPIKHEQARARHAALERKLKPVFDIADQMAETFDYRMSAGELGGSPAPRIFPEAQGAVDPLTVINKSEGVVNPKFEQQQLGEGVQAGPKRYVTVEQARARARQQALDEIRKKTEASTDPRLRKVFETLREYEDLSWQLKQADDALTSQKAAFMPDESMPDFGTSVSAVPGKTAERVAGNAAEARAQAWEARARLRQARQRLRETPATLTQEQRRLVSPEVRATPPDIGKPLRVLRDTLAKKKFHAEERQTKMVRQNLEHPFGLPHPGIKMREGRVIDTSEVSGRLSVPHRVLRAINRVNRGAVLYRPAYVPTNVISQEIMSAMHQGYKMLPRRVTAAQLRGTPTGRLFSKLGGRVEKLTPKQRQLLMAVSGSGRIFSSLPSVGARSGRSVVGHTARRAELGLEKFDTFIAHGFGKVVDDPYRTAAFAHEMRRLGIPKREIGKQLELAAQHVQREGGARLPGIANAAEKQAFETVRRAARRSNRAMVDYGRLSPNERTLRDILFLYPWVKGAIQYTGRFPIERPLQTSAYGAVGNIGSENTGLGEEVPSITKGSFVVGSRNIKGMGKSPVIVNPNTLTAFTQPRDTYNDLVAGIPGLGHPYTRYHNITNTLLPAYGSAIQSGGDPAKLWSNLAGSLPWVNLFKEPAENNPQNRLYPRSELDQIGQFVLGTPYPKPYNVVRGQSIWREEAAAGLGKAKVDELHEKNIESDLKYALTRLTGKPATEVPPAVRQGLAAWRRISEAERKVSGLRGAKRGNYLIPAARLLAVVVAETGRMPAKAEVEKILSIPDQQARQYLKSASKLEVVRQQSEMRKILNAVNKVIEQRDLPYLEGGKKVSVP